jgi:hypothetical protein
VKGFTKPLTGIVTSTPIPEILQRSKENFKHEQKKKDAAGFGSSGMKKNGLGRQTSSSAWGGKGKTYKKSRSSRRGKTSKKSWFSGLFK